MSLKFSEATDNQPLSIQTAQQMVDNWIREIGVNYFSELTNLAQLVEEVGELARVLSRTFGEQSFKETDRNTSLPEEMADILFVLICLANQTGVDLTEALKKNLESKSIRDAERHKKNPKLNPPVQQ
jgi:NTP pyrophosphatase (non-canonical NTP hydrolase)